MGWLSKLIGGEVVDAATGIANIVDRFVETPDEKRIAQTLLAKMAQRPGELQVELNKIEAGHRTIFVAGWRPAIGWICAAGLSFVFVINPVLQWITGNQGPDIDAATLISLVLSMLGMSGLRSVEKAMGKTK